MSALVTPPSPPAIDDAPAIAELHRLHAVQRQAFLADPYPAAAERKVHLSAAGEMVMSHRDDIQAAMSEDFGSHPELFTDLVEVLGVAARAAWAAEQLFSWMAEDERPADPALFGTAWAAIRYQPKGVIGSIVPWNFPFDLSVGPLVEMLAAGNRVIIKPSDYTPACGALLRRMVSETFGDDLVAVSVGGPSCPGTRRPRTAPASSPSGTWTGSPPWSTRPRPPARGRSRWAARATATRRLPLTLVVDPPASLRIMREEVFGPILPVIPYDDLSAAPGGGAGPRTAWP